MLFPRLEFDGLVKAHRAAHQARGFTCWQQFVAMLFCQLGVHSACARSAAGWPAARGN
jgi:hypothetical protein